MKGGFFMVDWVKIGSRFSNAVVQTLMVLMGRRPPMVSWALSFAVCQGHQRRDDLMHPLRSLLENRVGAY